MNKRRVSIKDVFSVKKSYTLKILLIIYLLSFLGATYNHVMDLIKFGLFPYQRLNSNVPIWLYNPPKNENFSGVLTIFPACFDRNSVFNRAYSCLSVG